MDEGKGSYWDIRGYGSTEEIFKQEISFAYRSEPQCIELLRRLVAKTLDYEEIASASLAERASTRTDHLRVHKEFGPDRFHLMCGDNPHFVAKFIKRSRLGN